MKLILLLVFSIIFFVIPKDAHSLNPDALTLTYTIPFRDTDVRVANPQAVRNLIRARWPNAQLQNWDTIVNQSIANGWNPAFVLTLWIEESGAQGEEGYADALGCEPTRPTTDINLSLRCLFNSFNTQFPTSDRFADFMCTYSESRLAPCIFNTNPNFPRAIRDWYATLIPSFYGGAVDTDVQIIGSPGQSAAGGIISVFLIEHEDGLDPSDPDRYREIFALEPVGLRTGIIKEAFAQSTFKSTKEINALLASEVIPNLYIIAIPPATSPGTYNLVAYMHRNGSQEVLDSDPQPLIITAPVLPPTPTPSPTVPPRRTITSISVNGRTFDSSTMEIPINLPGTFGTPQLFPVYMTIGFSDGTTRPVLFNFNYLNFLGTVLPSPSPLTGSLPYCALKVNCTGGINCRGSSLSDPAIIVVGGTGTFEVTQIPSSATNAQWSGLFRGIPINPPADIPNFQQNFNSRTGIWSVTYPNYGADAIGNYVFRFTAFDQNNTPLCQSVDTYITVSSQGSGGPTPPRGPGYTYPTPGSIQTPTTSPAYIELNQICSIGGTPCRPPATCTYGIAGGYYRCTVPTPSPAQGRNLGRGAACGTATECPARCISYSWAYDQIDRRNECR
ncbi:MAG: Uncharacterized protein G01um10147_717 [Microgenomates group bacterium Gr01-1014_7]|nr:MAG: Uncharacterized protein G01um10147_717 [Microgenomates group bacterium Gr01-1014_7]